MCVYIGDLTKCGKMLKHVRTESKILRHEEDLRPLCEKAYACPDQLSRESVAACDENALELVLSTAVATADSCQNTAVSALSLSLSLSLSLYLP